MKKLFVTATDTDAGKTYFATVLVKALVSKGFKVAVFKPISAGCELINGQLVNEDAEQLRAAANMSQPLSCVNPIAFEPPIAPHIAARKLGVGIKLDNVVKQYQQVVALKPDIIVCEGAGGWRLPIGQGQYLSSLPRRTKQQVILVVNLKLGCLNHAVLTYQSIINDGVDCIGWVANIQQDMPYLQENLEELKQLLAIPLIATLNFEPHTEKAVDKINTTLLV